LESLFKVDVMLPADDDFSRRQFERRQQAALTPDATQTIWIAAPEDTILAKLRWHRRGGGASERQLTDALGVLKVQGGNLDLDYMREWAGRMGVGDLLERLLGEVSDEWG
ncbi:MAG TPA: hypothetical protein VFX96_06515, partial [Pyrinomonadaceae bacterium]|nr:hypothetical protein [Pyrinomonadaceae bacterium]